VLEAYVAHMEANHYHSLLPRFLGLYKVKLPRMPAERLVVMNNVFYAPLESRLPPVRKVRPPEDLTTTPTLSSSSSSSLSSPSEQGEGLNKKKDQNKELSTPPLVRRSSITRAMLSARGRLFGDASMKKKDPLSGVASSHKSPIPPDVIAFLPPPSSPVSPSTPSNKAESQSPPPPPSTTTTPSTNSQHLNLTNQRPLTELSLRPIEMSQIYDLKGSLLKRFVSEEEQSRGERVLKDLNFCGYHKGTDCKVRCYVSLFLLNFLILLLHLPQTCKVYIHTYVYIYKLLYYFSFKYLIYVHIGQCYREKGLEVQEVESGQRKMGLSHLCFDE
jgi:hypothetical protein